MTASHDEAALDRARGALLGLAVGDALGTTLEFKPKDRYQPLTTIVGGGPFSLKPGEWTDDTSMALAFATSLIEMGGLGARDLMERFCAWAERGEYAHNGRCFDIGNTVRAALDCVFRGSRAAISRDRGHAFHAIAGSRFAVACESGQRLHRVSPDRLGQELS